MRGLGIMYFVGLVNFETVVFVTLVLLAILIVGGVFVLVAWINDRK